MRDMVCIMADIVTVPCLVLFVWTRSKTYSYILRGDRMKGQDLVRWKKEVYSRIQELDLIFKEDEKLREEQKNEWT